MVAQRVYGLALGYEDLNDHDALCRDPLLAMVAGKKDVEGQSAAAGEGPGQGPGGQEHAEPAGVERGAGRGGNATRRSPSTARAADRLLVDAYIEAQDEVPGDVILDLDATDDPLHGNKKGGSSTATTALLLPAAVYLCGKHVLCARLRPSNIDASAGALEEVERIVGQLRERGPRCTSRCGATAGSAGRR